MNTAIFSIFAFGLIVLLLVYIRAKTGNKYEIRNSDVLIALVPVAIGLILTGKIKTFEFGEFKIESAFIEASKAAIQSQVSKPTELPVERIARLESKGAVGAIPRMIEMRTEALVLRLGHGGYWGPAIREYLEKLSRHDFFKYIVITHADGSLFGIADARQAAAVLLSDQNTAMNEDFARWLDESNQEAIQRGLPGFVPAHKGITRNTDKLGVLDLMEKQKIEMLPVVDETGKFAGVVHRAELVASLVIDVAKRVKEK